MERTLAAAAPGRPRDERLDEAIVSATLELLDERGYAGMSLAAVAERAGTTTPAIYRRWPSKADLVLDAVFGTEGDEVVASSGDLEADVATMVRWALEKLGSSRGRAALAGLLAEPPDAVDHRLDQLASLWRRHGDNLDAWSTEGLVRPDIEVTAFIAALAGPAVLAGSVLGATADDDALVGQLTGILLEGVRGTKADRSIR